MNANTNRNSRRTFLKGITASLAATPLLRTHAGAAAPYASIHSPRLDEPFLICKGGESALVVAHEHRPAAHHFCSVVEELTGQKLSLVPEADESKRPLILIGDAREERIRKLVGHSRGGRLGPEGILLLTTHDSLRPVLIVTGSGRAGVSFACGELLNFHLRALPGSAEVPRLDLVDNPELPYRIFWNWDHSTNWVRGVPGEQEHGCVNPYMKPEDAYVADFKSCIDYMAEHKINGLIVWGFLRDSHGGVKNSMEVVKHSRERGVRVLPGIGTSFYGGFYYEGNHPFNVDTWLAKNPPELRFLDSKGRRLINGICPSKPIESSVGGRSPRGHFRRTLASGSTPHPSTMCENVHWQIVSSG